MLAGALPPIPILGGVDVYQRRVKKIALLEPKGLEPQMILRKNGQHLGQISGRFWSPEAHR